MRQVRQAAIGQVVAIFVTILVLTVVGGLLIVLEPRSSAADITPIDADSYSAPSAGPGAYGSGTLGPWQNLLHHISSEDQIRDVLSFDGVFMFGDSIAVQDNDALERVLANQTGDSIASHDWSGQPTSAAVDALEQWSRSYGLPRRIVMAVGTNDIFNPPAFAAQVERAMKIAGPDRTVYWVDVYANRTRARNAVPGADVANSAWVNRQLEDAAMRHPNLRIVRWSEFVTAQPGGPAKYLRDGVHTSQNVGSDARNQLISDALQSSRVSN
ncbi:hypothetical protein AB0E69_01220 [Kribbella sp. NPDC026611]|uniref:hypothetical protein n=1 Tax=Kribbella sp. NPDC026611 TaxID=3154911 RepID=UPI00340D2473